MNFTKKGRYAVGAYLDNSATTAVCDAAVCKATQMMTAQFGNPSSLHTLGIHAEQEMTAARRASAKLFGLQSSGSDPTTITFTSGGTEANNLAILGAAYALRRRGKHLVTTAIEHPSVLQTMQFLESDGFSLTVVSPDKNGDIAASAIADACTADTILVSAMLVNNELGTLLPIREAVPMIRRRSPNALIHCDAVQAAGKLPLKVLTLDVDMMSVSGHKLHAPKGVGALYVKRGVRLLPRQYGGGQERGLRSGTEATPAIAAFGEAINALPPSPKQLSHYAALRERLIDRLRAFDNVVLHTPQHGVPYILNFSVVGFRSETLVHFLAERDIYVSAGSACAKGHESHVLKALGLPPEQIASSLRVSLCADNRIEEIDLLADALSEAVSTLASTR